MPINKSVPWSTARYLDRGDQQSRDLMGGLLSASHNIITHGSTGVDGRRYVFGFSMSRKGVPKDLYSDIHPFVVDFTLAQNNVDVILMKQILRLFTQVFGERYGLEDWYTRFVTDFSSSVTRVEADPVRYEKDYSLENPGLVLDGLSDEMKALL